MPTSVTFENATFADAMKRVGRIAPQKAGVAFDKAAGIMMELTPGAEFPVVLRATDTNSFITEWVDVVNCEGDPGRWRVPARLLTDIATRLPIGTNKHVTLETGKEVQRSRTIGEGDNEQTLQFTVRQVMLKSGRTKATIGLIADYEYPNWDPVDTTGMEAISALGARIAQVAWAVDPKTVPYSGIHMTGSHLIATDRVRLAVVDCEIPQLHKPITVPAANVAPLLREMGDTQVGIVGNKLALIPNDTSQIQTRIYDDGFPNTAAIMGVQFERAVIVQRDEVADMVDRVLSIAGADRMPSMKLYIGGGELAVFLSDPQGSDDIEDAVDLPGQADHETVEFNITPKNLIDALRNAPNQQVVLHYLNPSKNLVHIDGGSGYRVWIMLRRDVGTTPTT